jgi:hypothetical protein
MAMADLVAPKNTDKNFFKKKTKKRALCLLVLMGVVAPINRGEKKKKKQKGPAFIGDDKEREALPPQSHP